MAIIKKLQRNTSNGEVYCTYEICNLLNQLDFKDRTESYYDTSKKLCSGTIFRSDQLPAPTLEHAVRWLRNVKNVHISMIYSYVKNEWASFINIYDEEKYYWREQYDFALADCLIDVLQKLNER